MQRQNNQSKSKNQSRHNVDPKAVLISKMTAEGVESGGRYWNEVVSEFNRSDNKTEFVKDWQIDHTRHNDLDIKPLNDKQKEDERALAENEEHQRQLEENQRKQQEQENTRLQEKELEIRVRRSPMSIIWKTTVRFMAEFTSVMY